MERVNDGVTAVGFSIVARREIDVDVTVGGVAFEVAFERHAVDSDALQLTLENFLKIRQRLNEVGAAAARSVGIFLRKQNGCGKKKQGAELETGHENTSATERTAGSHSKRRWAA